MRHVFFTRPCQLDRHTWFRHCQLNRLQHVIILQPSPETPARHQHMHMHLSGIQPGQLGRIDLHEARDLRARPDIQPPAIQQHRRSHRL